MDRREVVKLTPYVVLQSIIIPTEVSPFTHSPSHLLTHILIGLALRTVGYLFERIRNLTTKTTSITIKLSALEIYNEKITDLLKDIANNPHLLIHPSTLTLTHTHSYSLTHSLTHTLAMYRYL